MMNSIKGYLIILCLICFSASPGFSEVPFSVSSGSGSVLFRSAPGFLTLDIFDGSGNLMRILNIRGRTAQWDKRDFSGYTLAPGIYFARFSSGPRKAMLKFLLE